MHPPDELEGGPLPAPEGLERFARDLRAELISAAERDLADGRCRTHGSGRAGRPAE